MMYGMYNEPKEDVSVPPAYAFFQLNSKDRNTSSSSSASALNPYVGETQPWNNFLVQKPSPLLEAFAKRIGITEVAFPWAIPNINSYNDKLIIRLLTAPNTYTDYETAGIVSKFYSGSSLATAINTTLSNEMGASAPTFSWDTTSNTMSVLPVEDTTIQLSLPGLVPNSTANNASVFYNNPNLLKTMGFSFNQLLVDITNNIAVEGSPTRLLYTSYIDITSEKLHYNNEVNDGTSDNNKNTNANLCRIFCADETSSNGNWTTGQTPFMIHRQFRNPKMIKWNPRSFIDWFRVQIYDEWGNLVYIPTDEPITFAGNASTYPDFQMVFLATED